MVIDVLLAAGRRPRLYQPHGSSGWVIYDPNVHGNRDTGPKLQQRDIAGTSYLMMAESDAKGVAALAIPISGDPGGKTAWPEAHKQHLLRDLKAVDEAIIVGWRGADEHIVKLISDELGGRLARLHVVGWEDGVDEMVGNLEPWCDDDTDVQHERRGFRSYLSESDSPLQELFPLITAK